MLRQNKLVSGYFAAIILGIVIIVLDILFSGQTTREQSEIIDFSDDWLITSSGQKYQIDMLPISEKKTPGESISMTKTLPADILEGSAICFKSENIKCRVFINDEIIYEYGYTERLFGSSPGDLWHFIQIPNNSNGKTLTIEMNIIYKKASGFINRVQIGNRADMMLNFYRSNIFKLIVCIVILMVGVIFVFLDRTILTKYNDSNALSWLGIFAVILACWLTTQTQILPFLFGRNGASPVIDYVCLGLLPVSILMFIKKYNKLQNTRIFDFIMFSSIISIVVVILFHITGYMEMQDSITITHINILATILIAIVSIFKKTSQKRHENKAAISKNNKYMKYSLILLAITVIIDFMFYYLKMTDDYARFVRVGILIYIVFAGIDMVHTSAEIAVLSKQSEYNKTLAMIDVLTGVRSRTAYKLAIENLDMTKQSKNSLCVVGFDVNNLKIINDTYGHDKGDVALTECAAIIEKSFGVYDFCYRCGGDEFVVILTDQTQKKYEKGIQEMIDLLAETNSRLQLEIPLSIAYGVAFYNPEIDKSYKDVEKRADKAMYYNKKESKELESIKKALKSNDL